MVGYTDPKGCIVRQVEYYFGDINLPRDKFLQEEMKKDEGWIPLETMLKFNRLAKISTDIKEITEALEDSHLIEVSDDKAKIRRSPDTPLPDNTLEYWQEIKRRTVYIKGFPLDTTLDELQAFLNPHGDIKNILMRRLKKEKTFKGSVFVTFADKEAAETFAKDDTSTSFKDIKVTKLMQNEYWAKKSQETKQKRQAEKDAKRQLQSELKAEKEKIAMSSHFVKGAVLEISGLGTEPLQYDDLKTFFKQFGPVAFVAYEAGNDTAQVRFTATDDGVAVAAWEKAKNEEGAVVFKDKTLNGRVLNGEEEQKYWTEFTKNKIAKSEKSTQRKNKKDHRAEKRLARNSKEGFGTPSKKAKHIVFGEDDGAEESAIKKENEDQSAEEPVIKAECKQEQADA